MGQRGRPRTAIRHYKPLEKKKPAKQVQAEVAQPSENYWLRGDWGGVLLDLPCGHPVAMIEAWAWHRNTSRRQLSSYCRFCHTGYWAKIVGEIPEGDTSWGKGQLSWAFEVDALLPGPPVGLHQRPRFAFGEPVSDHEREHVALIHGLRKVTKVPVDDADLDAAWERFVQARLERERQAAPAADAAEGGARDDLDGIDVGF